MFICRYKLGKSYTENVCLKTNTLLCINFGTYEEFLKSAFFYCFTKREDFIDKKWYDWNNHQTHKWPKKIWIRCLLSIV